MSGWGILQTQSLVSETSTFLLSYTLNWLQRWELLRVLDFYCPVLSEIGCSTTHGFDFKRLLPLSSQMKGLALRWFGGRNEDRTRLGFRTPVDSRSVSPDTYTPIKSGLTQIPPNCINFPQCRDTPLSIEV